MDKMVYKWSSARSKQVKDFLTGEELKSIISEMGLNKEDLFFKCSDKKIGSDVWGESRIRITKETNIGVEYRKLLRLREISPANIPSVIGSISLGRMKVGYVMEYINGELLDHHDANSRNEPHCSIYIKATNSLVRLVKTFHAYNIGHGDLNPTNIFISKNVMLIDPLDSKDESTIIKYDKSILRGMLRKEKELKRQTKK